MKRILASVLALMLLAAPLALADEDGAWYEGPVLTFNAPRDAELALNNMTADSYMQVLREASTGEVIISAAYPTAEERDASIATLLGDVAAVAEPVGEYDALQGHGAQRLALTLDFASGELYILAPLMQPLAYAVNLVTVDAGCAFLFAAMAPESAYQGLADLVEAQIASLEIFDPDAKIMLVPETEETAAYELVGEFEQDAEADAFLVYALDAIRDVRLSTVIMNTDGLIQPDFTLGEWSEMDFGSAIRIRAYLPDALPGFAVTFTDQSGIGTTLYITMSGLDGSLLLIGG